MSDSRCARRGLWAGVYLDPERSDARRVVERLAEHGVLTRDTHGRVIRFAPPIPDPPGAAAARTSAGTPP